jgi:hypothetical protein
MVSTTWPDFVSTISTRDDGLLAVRRRMILTW